MEFEEPTFDNFMDDKIGFLLKETKGIEFEEFMENEDLKAVTNNA